MRGGGHTLEVGWHQGWGWRGGAPVRLKGRVGACERAVGPRYLVKPLQKSLRLGQRREGGGHHLEGPRRRRGDD